MKKIIPGIIKIIGAIHVPVLKYRLGKIPKTPKKPIIIPTTRAQGFFLV